MSWADFHYYIEIQFPLNNFEEYAGFIETTLRGEVTRFEEMAKGLDEEESQRFWDWHIDEVGLYDKDFPNILRTSLLISIYSFVEKKLVSLCVSETSGKTFKDLKGNKAIIDKAKDYMLEVLNKEFPSDSLSWAFLQDVRAIRNCLVHSGGIVTELNNRQETEIRNIISNMPHVEIDENDNIKLDSEFCIVFTNHLHDLFYILYERESKVPNAE